MQLSFSPIFSPQKNCILYSVFCIIAFVLEIITEYGTVFLPPHLLENLEITICDLNHLL